MNSENFIFFANNGFLITDVAENVDGHIYNPTEVNKIVADFGFQKGYRKKNVSIADIVGYDSEFHGNFDNIFDSMDYFFDEYGSLYQKRSTKMLEYLKDDNKTIGFSAFRKSNENPIYIFIKKDCRSNGYGKFLFSQMFEKLKDLDFDEFIFTFDKSNIPILRIL